MNRFVIRWAINAVALYAAIQLVPGIQAQNTGWGAILGLALIFGLVNAFGILVAPRLAIAFAFILMIIVLIVRPWGLMGKPE